MDIGKYRISITVAAILTVIYTTEIYVLLTSQELFRYVYVTQMAITPGLILGPLSHGPLVHFTVNIFLYGMYGPLLERRLSDRHYASILILAAYVPVYTQVIVDSLTGSTGTAGFSGAVYAVVPLYTLLALRDWASIPVARKPFVVGGLFAIVYIPLTILDIVSFSSLPAAKITHSLGYLSGLVYGAYLYRTSP
jgi:membrane associated rhomboid family serine protease